MPLHNPEALNAAEIMMVAARGFYEKNWMLGTSGNLSIRLKNPDAPNVLRYLITASGRDKGALTPDDFVLAGEGGEALAPAGAVSSAETLLHEAVYKAFPAVSAVYHVHTVAAGLLSNRLAGPESTLRFSDLEMLKGLGYPTHDVEIHLPVISNTQDIAALGVQLACHLNPEVPGFLLRGHGLYTWGKTPFEAKRRIEIWEYLFQYKLWENLLGT